MNFRAGLIGEEIDGEVIMIDLSSGIYYSLRGASVVVWRLLREGVPADDLTAAVEARVTNAPAGAVTVGVEDLLIALRKDALLAEEPSARPESVGSVDTVWEYQPFEFERFDDMSQVIQLDPVHDVDPARGWPHPSG